jgi:hypothetical protein
MKTLVAVYRTLKEGDHAVTALRGEAIAGERISLVMRHPFASSDDATTNVGDRSDAGAAATTGITGMLASFAALMIPYFGPVLAIGPLGLAMAAGTTTGRERTPLVPSLMAAGVPEPDAHAYFGAVRDGRALVMATVDDDELEPAIRALARWEPVRVVQHAA